MVPDFIANAGGVTVSYFEWLKNTQHIDLGLLVRRWEHNYKFDFNKALDGLAKKVGANIEVTSLMKEGPTEVKTQIYYLIFFLNKFLFLYCNLELK